MLDYTSFNAIKHNLALQSKARIYLSIIRLERLYIFNTTSNWGRTKVKGFGNRANFGSPQ